MVILSLYGVFECQNGAFKQNVLLPLLMYKAT